MCGICGKYNFDIGNTVNENTVKKMNQALYHRGPDDEGYFFDKNVGFGVRRLSVIDAAGGHQPMYGAGGNLAIAFNGEIYNFRELREDLIKRGHAFKTRGDTEVLLRLYEEKGRDCLKDLNGMFAFAVWDKRNKKLFIARDRLGIKPLYYFKSADFLSFGSEIKAILKDPSVTIDQDLSALHHYFSYNYVPSPGTLFKNIYKLSAGHYMECSSKGIFIKKYWDIEYPGTQHGDERLYTEEFYALLEKSVKRRMVSDVPLGVFLSGGLDSSAVLLCAEHLSDKPVKTFSVGFKEKNYDESEFSSRMSAHLKTEHRKIIMKSDWAGALKDIVWHLEGLAANTTAIPLYFLSRHAKESVTVALSGLGGDEILGGYDTYIADILSVYYRKTPGIIRKPLASLLLKSFRPSDTVHSLSFKIRHFLSGAVYPSGRAHYWWRQIFSEEEKRSLYKDYPLKNLYGSDPYDVYGKAYADSKAGPGINQFLYADTKIWLPDSELILTDMMGMANSLEIRVPFLDHELVEFAAKMPLEMKIRGLNKKYILKKAMKGKLPKAILRKQKQGFSVPFSIWLKNELKDVVTDVLSENAVNRSGLFNKAYIMNLMAEHFSGANDNSRKIFGLLNYFLWYDMFMRGA